MNVAQIADPAKCMAVAAGDAVKIKPPFTPCSLPYALAELTPCPSLLRREMWYANDVLKRGEL
jgi:hypothetical protein